MLGFGFLILFSQMIYIWLFRHFKHLTHPPHRNLTNSYYKTWHIQVESQYFIQNLQIFQDQMIEFCEEEALQYWIYT